LYYFYALTNLSVGESSAGGSPLGVSLTKLCNYYKGR